MDDLRGGTETEERNGTFMLNSKVNVRHRGNEKPSGQEGTQTSSLHTRHTEPQRIPNGMVSKSNMTDDQNNLDNNDDGNENAIGSESEKSLDALAAKIKEELHLSESLGVQCEQISSILNETLTKIENAIEVNSQNKQYDGATKRKEVYFCRICHEIGSKQRFISPCMCKGSLYLVHKSCLETWLAASDSTQCELCGFTYRTQRLPKYMVFSSIFAWLMCPTSGSERRMLLWDIMTLMVLLPLMILCSILGLRVANNVLSPEVQIKMGEAVMTRVLQMVLLSGVLLLDLGVLSWGAIRIQFHFHQWYVWYRKNCKVILLDFLDHPDFPLQTLSHASSASVRVINF